jgi:ABC-2 type transport system permease protein
VTTPAEVDAVGGRPGEIPPTPGATWALYRLLLRSQVTRARLIALGSLGAVGIIVGAAIGHGADFEHLHRGARFINAFGLYLLVPVATLVFASAALGDPTEDGSLVYLWLRPVARWKIVAAAAASSFTVTWPVVIVPLTISAALTRAGSSLVVGTLAATTVSMVGYVGVFVALGLRVKRALVWGLLYIFIWEGFVATANTTAARLAIRAYGRSTLSGITGQDLSPSNVVGNIPEPWRWIVPALVALVALAYATRRLKRQDVA